MTEAIRGFQTYVPQKGHPIYAEWRSVSETIAITLGFSPEEVERFAAHRAQVTRKPSAHVVLLQIRPVAGHAP